MRWFLNLYHVFTPICSSSIWFFFSEQYFLSHLHEDCLYLTLGGVERPLWSCVSYLISVFKVNLTDNLSAAVALGRWRKMFHLEKKNKPQRCKTMLYDVEHGFPTPGSWTGTRSRVVCYLAAEKHGMNVDVCVLLITSGLMVQCWSCCLNLVAFSG